MKFLRHIPWANLGKTVVGLAQVAAGVAILYAAPANADIGIGLIVAGAGAVGLGLPHKILKGIEAAAKAETGNRSWHPIDGGRPK